MTQKLPVVCLMGPTAVGKSDLAMQLAEYLSADIISVDSAMVYRGMNIGTAKPNADTLAKFPHQLIDVCDAAETYSAAEFCRDAKLAIEHSHTNGRLPLLVGGTMLYFRALQQGMAKLPEADQQLRQQISGQAREQGWQVLHQQLQKIDPIAAARIKPTDRQRLQRALEVYALTGQRLSSLQAQTKHNQAYEFINLALIPEQRENLHRRIEQRFDAMLEAGLVDEVKGFFQRNDLDLEKPSMRCVGYRQIWLYLDKVYSEQMMRERAIIATRQLAKRQLTWLRSWEMLRTFMLGEQPVFEQILPWLQKMMVKN